jgi:hypothetical protein
MTYDTHSDYFVSDSSIDCHRDHLIVGDRLVKVLSIYEDRLSGAIPDELWTPKSAELQEELRRVRAEMERHEGASEAYETAGSRFQNSRKVPIRRTLREVRAQARLVKTVVSNSTCTASTSR